MKKSLILFTLILMVLCLLVGCNRKHPDTQNPTTDTDPNGGTEAICDHVYDEGIVTKKPTCTVKGVKTCTCQICGHTREEEIPTDDGHEYDDGVITTKPTCFSKGVKTYTCALCGHIKTEEIPTDDGHEYGEGVITTQPTCSVEGVKTYICLNCGNKKTEILAMTDHTLGEWYVINAPTLNEEGRERADCVYCTYYEDRAIDKIPAKYYITVDEGNGRISMVGVDDSGAYLLRAPERVGYRFAGWRDANGNVFKSAGNIFSDVKIKAAWELLDTCTLAELIDRAAAGASEIRIAADIVITEPVFFTGQTKLYSDGNYTIKRHPDYNGDLFVVGQDKDGIPSLIFQKQAILTLGGGQGTLTVDGNRDGVNVSVLGSAVFISDSATVNLYDGIIIANNKKLGNERTFTCEAFVGDLQMTRAGGAALLIMNGTVNMYGGVIENNLVVTENTIITNDDGTETWLDTDGCGGAVYNLGNFNMYSGIIRSSEALRGGAIYNDEIVLLVSGTISDNLSHSYGGAVSSSSSAAAQMFIGSDKEDGKTMSFINNHSIRAGGALYSNTSSPIVIYGNTEFVGNSTDSSGGAIYTGGALTVRNTSFVGNSCQYSGGALYLHYSNPDYTRRHMEITGCDFTENKAGLGGAVILSAASTCEDGTYATITGCTFTRNEAIASETQAGNGGALYITRKSDAVISGCDFVGNKATNNAGALSIHSESVVTIKDVTFTDNIAVCGGAMYSSSKSTVDMSNIKFQNNSAVKNGETGGNAGAFYAHSILLTMSDIEMTGNTAANNAGALYMCAIELEIDSTVSFKNNTVGNHGGAIYITYSTNEDGTRNGGVLNATDVVFESNSALSGGAISARSASMVNLLRVVFKDNSTPGAKMGMDNGGGAIYSNNSTLNLTDVLMDANSSGYYGGAIKADECDMTLKNTQIINSSGGTGGAIYARRGALNAEDLTLMGNSSSLNGVIYLTGNTAVFNRLNAKNNSAINGGVIYAGSSSNVTVKDSTISENSANNGGIFYFTNGVVSELVGCDISNNTANNGGAIYAMNNSSVTVSDCSFASNTAQKGNGGAIYLSGAALAVNGDVLFEGNTASNHGGAICVMNYTYKQDKTNSETGETETESVTVKSSLSVDGALFDGNSAARGGAIYVTTNSYTVKNTKFNNNQATDENYGGGAIYSTGAIGELSCVEFSGNTSHKGGAIALHTQSSMTITSMTAYGNTATENSKGELGVGGVFFVNNSELKLVEGEGDIILIGGSDADWANTAVSGGAIRAENNATVTINGAEIINNTAKTHGGAIYATGCNIELVDVNISDNSAGINGGAIYAAQTTVNVSGKNTEFCNNSSTEHGGAFYLSYNTIQGEKIGSTLNITDATLSQNTSLSGGAISGRTNSVINLTNVKLISNSVPNATEESGIGGGAIYVNNSQLVISGSILDSNSSGYYGGAIRSDASKVTVKDNTVITNNRGGTGAALYMSQGSELIIDGITLDNNTSSSNGVIYMNRGKGILTNISAKGNKAYQGGVFYFSGGSIEIINSEATENTATHGGVLYVSGRASVTLSGCELSSNNATKGGAIYTLGGTTVINNSIISNNTAASKGGAICAEGGTISIAEGCELTGNTARLGGAIALVNEAAAEIMNTALENNTASQNGGAISIEGASLTVGKDTSFVGNTASNYGGALCVMNYTYEQDKPNAETGETESVTVKSSLSVDGALFDGNSAARGGAIYVATNSYTVKNTEFNNNQAIDENYGGGAIYSTGAIGELSNIAFNGNTSHKGGAVALHTQSSMTITSMTAYGNTATENSKGELGVGGVFFVNNSELKLVEGEGDIILIGGSDAGCANTAVSGGAIRAENKATVIISGAEFINNIAGASGGAIYVTSSSLNVDGSVMSGNIAEQNGGAIYISKSTVNISSSELNSNSATNGGAIYSNNSEITIRDSKLNGNSATNGGAIYGTNTTDVELTNVSLSKNTAETNGGAVYLTASFLNGEDNIFTANKAGQHGGAIYLTHSKVNDVTTGSTAALVDGSFEGNSALAGGAISIRTASSATLDGTILKNNLASAKGYDAEGGGAIYVGFGNLDIKNISASLNTSLGYGGVINSYYGNVTVDVGIISQNRAEFGGAIYSTNGSVYISDVFITGNDSGVYMHGGDLEISGNTRIKNNDAGNVYLGDGVIITVVGVLGENASIGVTTESFGVNFAKPDGVYVSDLSDQTDKFFSDVGAPIYAKENGQLAWGFVILEQPWIFNGYTVITTGEPTYAWYTWQNGQLGAEVAGQTANTLTEGVAGQSYVCIATLNGETVMTQPITYYPIKTHPVCGETCDCVGATHKDIEWIPVATLDELLEAVRTDGNYYLACDLTLQKSLVINANINLCLNGKKLTCEGDVQFSIITVKEGAALTLTDCSSTERAGYIDPETKLWTEGTYAGEGDVIEYTLYGGVITGGNAGAGGAIYSKGTLIIYNVNFAGNRSSGTGGAIWTQGNISIYDTTFVGNYAATNGGAINLAGATLTAELDNRFMYNTASNHAGAIYVTWRSGSDGETIGAVVNMTDGLFQGNSAIGGGAVSVRTKGKATFNGTTFIGNSVDGYADDNDGDGEGGGAIYVGFGRLTLNDVDMTSNTSSGFGGAIEILSSTVNINNGRFSKNSALYTGALHIHGASNGSTVTITGATFTENSSTYENTEYDGSLGGGAINVNKSTLTLSGVVLDGNTTGYYGGALLAYGSTVIINDGSVISNNAGATGAALYFRNACDVTIEDTSIENNTSSSNGVVYINSGVANITNISASGNKAYQGGVFYFSGGEISINESVATGNKATNGGALYVGGSAKVKVTSSTFSSNNAASGGAIYSTGGAINIDQSTLSSNTATSKGGAVYVEKGTVNITDNSKIEENTAHIGGAITLVDGAIVGIENTDLTNNSASQNGGAVYVEEASLTVGEGTSFVGNTASNNGGAIYSNNSEIAISSSELNGNSATNGGAIYATNTTDVELINVSMNKNTAVTNGGAVYITASSLSGENNVFTENKAGEHGGAIYLTHSKVNEVTTGSTAALVGGSFEGNSAVAGGAISIRTASSATISGTTFIGNSVDGYLDDNDGDGEGGGAIYVGFGGLTLNDVDMTSNTSSGFGGAIEILNSTVNISNGKFSKNSALYTGALHVHGASSGSTVTITGATFTENSSTYENTEYDGSLGGGAINVNNSTLTLSGVVLDGNTTGYYGGALLACGSTVIINDGSVISNNTGATGAALYLCNSSDVTIEESSITSNIAASNGAVYINSGSLNMTEVTATQNKASSGGVIYASGASTKITLTNCNLSENNATTGGAMYIVNSTVSIVGGEFSSNTSQLGGAIYGKLAEIQILDAVFAGNSATKNSSGGNGNGGAIYMAGGSITVSGDSIFSNNTAENHAGAIYIAYVSNTDGTRTPATLSMTDGLLEGNSASFGGAISSRTDCEVNLTGTVLRNNQATSKTDAGGGAIYTNNNTLTLSGVTLEGNSTGYYGGAISASAATVTINNNSVITGNKGATGSALHFKDGGSYTLENITISNTKGTGSGVIYITSSGTLNIIELTADGNTSNNGGVIYSSGSAVIIVNNSSFTNNVATTSGGAIDHRSSGKLTVNNTVFSGNTAGLIGGAITAKGKGAVEIKDCAFESNKALATKTDSSMICRGGGAIYVSSSSNVTVQGGSFTGNSAAGTKDVTTAGSEMTDAGGAILVDGGKLNVTGATFDSNTANNGGAIGTSRATTTVMNITGCTFTDNISTKNGGGIYIQNGVINDIDSIIIADCTFIDNSASTASGSSIYIRTASSATIVNITSTGGTWSWKGAVYVTGGARVTLKGTVNMAGKDEIYVTGSGSSAVVVYSTEEEKAAWTAEITTASSATVTYVVNS